MCAIASRQGKFFEIIKNSNGKLSHQHENGNVLNRSSMDIDLFNANLSDEIYIYISIRLIETKSFGVLWSFGGNSMRMCVGGRQISNRQEEVHKRGGLQIK